jgi:3',5'-cyclic AMP phosphodiesterase CpdA
MTNIARCFKYQILSDLHLEKIPKLLERKLAKSRLNELAARNYYCHNRGIYTPPPRADNLFLAGDIGTPLDRNYEEFLKYCAGLYKQVYLITGNHEYYLGEYNELTYLQKMSYNRNQDSKWMEYIDNKIKSIISENALHNIHFFTNKLHNKYDLYNHVVPNPAKITFTNNLRFHQLHIYGTTLWTQLSDQMIHNGYDISAIPQWSGMKRNMIHCEQSEYICKLIADPLKSPIMIMTHHLPSPTLIDPDFVQSMNDSNMNINMNMQKKSNSRIYELYASSIWEMIYQKRSVIKWIYGHTHQTSEELRKKKVIDKVFEANPLGSIEKRTIDEIIDIFEKTFTVD